jgi:4-hydroxybenzoate polyprenyltransferase
MKRPGWPRILVLAGLVVMLLGALDPLEGSLLVLVGAGAATLGAFFSKSRQLRFLAVALVLVAIGVAALWGLSALGGIGGPTGRSNWWGLTISPYPVGWVLGILGAIRTLRETRARTPDAPC